MAQYDYSMPDIPDLVAGTQESITVSTTAIGITANIRTPTADTNGDFIGQDAKAAYVIIEDDAIRWTCHGTAPTATTGMHVIAAIDAHVGFVIYGATNIKNFKMIKEDGAGGDSIATVTCFF